VPEVVLAELAGDALEAHQRRTRHRPHPTHQLVDGALPTAVAVLIAEPTHDLGSAHAPPTHEFRLFARGYRRLSLDPSDALDGHPGLGRHGRLDHPHCAQNLNLMPSHGSDHPLPLPGAVVVRHAREERDLRAVLDLPELSERDLLEFSEPARLALDVLTPNDVASVTEVAVRLAADALINHGLLKPSPSPTTIR
jgi:hypothetical protein